MKGLQSRRPYESDDDEWDVEDQPDFDNDELGVDPEEEEEEEEEGESELERDRRYN
jgi:hypothetical protein